MNPGRLDQRIAIFKNKKGFDDYGEPIDDLEKIMDCWASVRNKSGKEMFEASTPYAKTVTSFLIRYRKDKAIDTTMKIEFNSGLYNIVYVDNYNFSNRYIEITAEKVM